MSTIGLVCFWAWLTKALAHSAGSRSGFGERNFSCAILPRLNAEHVGSLFPKNTEKFEIQIFFFKKKKLNLNVLRNGNVRNDDSSHDEIRNTAVRSVRILELPGRC